MIDSLVSGDEEGLQSQRSGVSVQWNPAITKCHGTEKKCLL